MKTILKICRNWALVIFAGILPLAFSQSGEAAIYKHVDSEGRLIKYSDQPQKAGDKPIEISKPALEENSDTETRKSRPKPIPNKPKSKPRKPETDEPKAVIAYSAVAILKPADEEAIRANGGVFPVELASQPALDTESGHRYVIMVDGKKHTQSTETRFNLENMDRGAHSISAEIHDRKGNSLATSSSTKIYVLRAFRR